MPDPVILNGGGTALIFCSICLDAYEYPELSLLRHDPSGVSDRQVVAIVGGEGLCYKHWKKTRE
jgi:hypothetical protein